MNVKDLLWLASTKWMGLVATLGFSICQVQFFGTTELMEAFLAGTALFGMLLSLSQSGQLAEIFLPEYLRLKNEFNKELANDAFCVVLNWLMALVLGSSALCCLFAPYIISTCYPGFNLAAQHDTTLVFRVACIFLALDISASFMKTVLNAEEIYGRPELIGSLSAVIGCGILIATATALELWSLIIAFAFAKVLSFGYYLHCIYQLDLRYKFVWNSKSFDSLGFFKTAYSSIAYAIATQTYSLVLNATLSRMPQGYFAVFRYVINLHAKIRGSVTQPLVTVFFTQFSNDYTKSKDTDARRNFREAIAYSTAATGFIGISIFAYGEIALQIAWGGKDFSADEVHFAWEMLCWSTIALAVGGVGGIFRKIVVSVGRARRAYLYWTVSQLMTAVAIVILARSLGVESLKYFILANSILLAIPSWIMAIAYDRSLRNPFELSLVRMLVTLAILFPISLLIAKLDAIYGFSDKSKWEGALFLSLAAGLTLVCFLTTAWFANVPGIRGLLGRFTRKIKRHFSITASTN